MKQQLDAQAMQALQGEVIGTSPWLEITQDRIDLFAQATGDFQFIHTDPVAAAQTPFGGTIAHGFLTLALLPFLLQQCDAPQMEGVRMGLNYGSNRLRFLAPVRCGKRVRAIFKLLELSEKSPGQWQHTTEVTVEIEGEPKPALICEWITQVFV
jgi:acyl dehydratase